MEMPGEGSLSPGHRRLTSKPLSVPLGHPGWMFSHLDPHAAEAYQGGTIHSECLNSRLANGSEVENNRRISVPVEVLFPSLVLRVK